MTQEEEVKQLGVWTYLENAVFSYHGCVSSLNLVRQMKTASKIHRMDLHTVKAASESVMRVCLLNLAVYQNHWG